MIASMSTIAIDIMIGSMILIRATHASAVVSGFIPRPFDQT
jgi:hypothetical protein